MKAQDFIARANQGALANRHTMWNTYEIAWWAADNKVPGDFVECGVYAGMQVAVMWKALQDLRQRRRIHLFDSFQGVPPAGEKDGNDWQRPEKVGAACSSRQNTENWLKKLGVDFSDLVWHPGWFADTVPGADPSEIALLRIDGDIYESVKVCLDHLYARVSLGGYVIIDDYALQGGRRAVDDFLAEHGLQPEIIKVPNGGGPVWWRKR